MIGSFALSALAGILDGRLHGVDVGFDSVSTDTRALQSGDLFVALAGANFDGNDYVVVAAEKGACAALVGRYTDCELPQLEVADTTRALGQLAGLNRQRSRATVIGITGSQGKTTVKEMTGRILGMCARTLVTRGNLNNNIGVPLTLMGLRQDHEFAVLELGANGPGEIAWTSSLAKPDVVLITNAAGTHLEGFGNLQGVVTAKGELLDSLQDKGVAVLNADDSHFEVWRRRAAPRRTVRFSLRDASAEYRAEAIDADHALGTRFQLRTPMGSRQVSLALPGVHNVANGVAAAAAAMEAGAGLEQIVAGLETMQPVRGRMFRMAGWRGSRVIDDSYNASPSSFQAAIEVLAAFPGKRVLVAGEMAELGHEKETAHLSVGRMASVAGIEQVFTIGDTSRLISQSCGARGRHFDTPGSLVEACREIMDSTTTILVKGSRSAGMERIVQQLTTGEVR